MRQGRKLLIAASLGLATVAGPAGAVQTIGGQTIVDFEELAASTNAIYYAGIDTHVTGGTRG